MKPRRQQILDYLYTYQKRNGFVPTYREIGEACGLKSVASVNYQLQQLAASGHIRIRLGQARAITLLNREDSN